MVENLPSTSTFVCVNSFLHFLTTIISPSLIFLYHFFIASNFLFSCVLLVFYHYSIEFCTAQSVDFCHFFLVPHQFFFYVLRPLWFYFFFAFIFSTPQLCLCPYIVLITLLLKLLYLRRSTQHQ